MLVDFTPGCILGTSSRFELPSLSSPPLPRQSSNHNKDYGKWPKQSTIELENLLHRIGEQYKENHPNDEKQC
jgi:hypothetical protein